MAFQRGEYRLAVSHFQGSALKGGALPRFYLGRLYLEGKGVARDERRGASLILSAARGDHPGAMALLGELLLSGRGLARDPEQALVWTRRAAEAGSPSAQYRLATLLLEGRGVAADHRQAGVWMRRAALNGVAAAQAGVLRAEFAGQEATVGEAMEVGGGVATAAASRAGGAGAGLYAQIASFRSRSGAESARAAAAVDYGPILDSHHVSLVEVTLAGEPWYRLQVGPHADVAGAKAWCGRFREHYAKGCFVTRRR